MRRSLLLCFALLLAACAGSLPAPGTPTPAAPVSAGERAMLILWHAWPAADQAVLLSQIERFNRANPTIQVVAQARPSATMASDLRTAVAEGGGPHLALLPSHVLGGLAEAGQIQPIDDLLPASERERLLPSALGAAEVRMAAGGSLYGVPITFDTLALYYNRSILLRPPDDTVEMVGIARGITDTRGEPPYWGLAYNLNLDRTIGYMYAFGGQIFDADGNLVLGLDGRAGVEAWLAWLTTLYRDDQLLAGLDGMTVDTALLNRQALMTIDWAHALPVYRSLWPDSLGVAPLPRQSETDQPARPYVQSMVLSLNARISDPAERTAAAVFMRFLVAEETQRALLYAGRQPALRSLDLAAPDPALDPALRAIALVFRAQAAQGQPMPNSRAANEIVWPALADMQSSALRGLLTPEQAVAGAETLLRSRLEPPPTPTP